MNRFFLMLPILLSCKQDMVLSGRGPGPSASSTTAPVTSTTLHFSGYNWTVKNGSGIGPGPNTWRAGNAWVDAAGLLHLKVSYDSAVAKWVCAGITSVDNFGYGTYQWQVQGPVSTLDKNIVAGLFHYAGPDGFNEMDVEFARWGDDAKPNVNYSVYPAAGTSGKAQHMRTAWTQSGGTSSTHRYTWTKDSVVFKSMNGFYNDDTNLFFTYTFLPPNTIIPTAAMPVKMNLWCFRGMGPSDGKAVEIVVRSFKFTPAP